MAANADAPFKWMDIGQPGKRFPLSTQVLHGANVDCECPPFCCPHFRHLPWPLVAELLRLQVSAKLPCSKVLKESSEFRLHALRKGVDPEFFEFP